MQTFLPYPDFAESARVLDRQRLGKQRVEAWQLLNAIEILNSHGSTKSNPWGNHPAATMWQHYPDALIVYGIAICREWKNRGYRDTMLFRFESQLRLGNFVIPWWLGDPAFHAAHRSNLLRKAPEHYAQLGWAEPPTLPYQWPGRTAADGFRTIP